jgi:hypothetical protein
MKTMALNYSSHIEQGCFRTVQPRYVVFPTMETSGDSHLLHSPAQTFVGVKPRHQHRHSTAQLLNCSSGMKTGSNAMASYAEV